MELMRLHSFRIKNFRRLQDVYIDLEQDVSIFVGSNNSGKTSATHAIQMFLAGGSDTRLSIHDFNSKCWQYFDQIGNEVQAPEVRVTLPKLTLDLWIEVEAGNLHRVIPLLPNLDWASSKVGVRIEFAPKNEKDLLARFHEEKTKAAAHRSVEAGKPEYHPWPKTLTDYLSKRLSSEYELRYFVLDPAHFDTDFKEDENYEPARLAPPENKSGAQVLKDLIRIDFLDAQRHLTDDAPSGRAEDLSKRLSRFYSRHLQKREDDYDALKALAESEARLNEHLARVFEPTLGELRKLGYPGLTNPRLVIKSALNPASVMNQSARVHYTMDGSSETDFTLPDKYNGLGFKNLIYMVVELLDLHAQWEDSGDDRPPLHLVFIEEPEAHMHAQLQQVFVQRIFDILRVAVADAASYSCQLVITTHSAHILFERGFKPIRYFRRKIDPASTQTSEVLNVSKFYDATPNPTRDFLERYMKLTHCDLFFADAAILVEGNAERLLMPLMIQKAASRLQSTYLSTLEVGGAFGHRFRELIEFLGITTLIITDIDSVRAPATAIGVEGEVEENDSEADGSGRACMVGEDRAVTSNQTLIKWLPRKSTIVDLLASTSAEKTQPPGQSLATIRVAYQTGQPTTWNGETSNLVGRTFEEAFALENLNWCQDPDRKKLGLRVISRSPTISLSDIAKKLFKRVLGNDFDKTDFALGLLAEDPESWSVPSYIAEGLSWLNDQIIPTIPGTNGLNAGSVEGSQ
jgi:predicted ATP-dependent endonuclease of OLD family